MKLEDQYIQLMKRNRDLRMELLMLAEELDKQDDLVRSKDIADKLIYLLSKKSPLE